MDANFKVTVRQRPRVEGVINILASRRINTADQDIPQVSPSFPTHIFFVGRHFPVVSF
jgi:hypothetical protein